VRKETTMEIFTDVEKQILKGTDKRFKWIARDKDGELCIYERKPFREDGEYFGTLGSLDVFNKCVSDVLFKNVTWENSPIQYRDDELLTHKEREYLNENHDYAGCDQFVCSNCGIELQDWHRVERDEDDGDVTYHQYEFKYCPNCGARIMR
jgi:DNA-directed RNA polymerase subunit RPC12/RpoP